MITIDCKEDDLVNVSWCALARHYIYENPGCDLSEPVLCTWCGQPRLKAMSLFHVARRRVKDERWKLWHPGTRAKHWEWAVYGRLNHHAKQLGINQH